MRPLQKLAAVFATVGLLATAQVNASTSSSSSCPSPASSHLPAPSVAPGYNSRLIASGLTSPRGCIFDSAGHLLVIERGKGVTALTLKDNGGACLSVAQRSTIVSDSTLNHGITLSHDQKTLYASSPEAVYAWPYDAMSARTTGKNITLVNNMTTSDHTTRTLLLSKKVNNTLVVTRGSTANIDPLASDIKSGHSQIKAFDISNVKSPYNFNTAGKLLGWGLRNDVGIDEEPVGGGLYSVENSADQITRQGQDVHQNNPGEEMNFLGYLNGTHSFNQGGNFGYPKCFTAWNTTELPQFTGTTGMAFAIGTLSSTNNDSICQKTTIAPRLTFQAHMAPLSLLFNDKGTEGWVTFHGSWDRTNPVGYKVSLVQFANGAPVANPASTTALQDIVSNQDNSKCAGSCFRPVGLAWDSQGRLFFTSDSSGEIYVITSKSNNGSINGAMASESQSSTSPTSSTSTASGSLTGSPHSLGSSVQVARAWGAVGLATFVAALLLM